MHDLQYNGGNQVRTATGLTAACTHKSALSSSQPTGQSTMYLYGRWLSRLALLSSIVIEG